ncbi:SUMF1/EgtB/PvdO family nonheme iron enzyme [candidate division KSB1 bacterium]|nr:SUMF1/EgtB/PvdO family nonheme iron enzyme [candidate division KSB1 bacterium]
MNSKFKAVVAIFLGFITTSAFAQTQSPKVTDVTANQRIGTKVVDINYTLVDDDTDTLYVAVQVSQDSGKTYDVPVISLTGTGNFGYGVEPGDNSIIWNAGEDFPEEYGTEFRVKIIASDAPIGKLVSIPADCVIIGSDESLDEFKPAHKVSLSAFMVGVTEITNIQYKLFCDATGRSYPEDPVTGYFIDKPDYPVVNVSWYNAVEYCNWLSTQHGLTPCYNVDTWTCDFSKDGYRLPTEAEWERISRGRYAQEDYPWGYYLMPDGANYTGYTGDLVASMANFASGRGPLPVASFDSTGFGVFDIAGNVAEWCNDWYNRYYYYQYYQSPVDDPTGPQSGDEKAKRGGDWDSSSEYMRCYHRNAELPGNPIMGSKIGFRVVRRK